MPKARETTMKSGKTLQELAAEIQAQSDAKRDYVANTAAVDVACSKGELTVKLPGQPALEVNDIAHGQLATLTGIPKPYYDKMRQQVPELLATNVAEWFARTPSKRLFRTFDWKDESKRNTLRANLSDKYMPLDNDDLAEALLPVLLDRKLDVVSCDVTPTKLYIKAVDKQLFRDVPIGFKMGDGSHRLFDTCAPVVIVSNSEVGFGRYVIDTGCYTRACTNLCMWSNGGMKRTHVGARHSLSDGMSPEELEKLLSYQAKKKTIEALWLQSRDVITAAFDKDVFTKRCEQLAATAENKIKPEDVTEVVERVRERFTLTEGESKSVLARLIESGNLSQYGLHAAITRTAEDSNDYDRATDLEYLGGKVIELPKTEWARLAEAA